MGRYQEAPGLQATEGDHVLAREIAQDAGRLLVELRLELADSDAAHLRAEGDRRSHELIMGRLAGARPYDGILSEEGRDDRKRLGEHRVWIVDPLDGTREYGEPPRTDWAVHVALCIDGVAVAGAVAIPADGVVYTTRSPLPAKPRPEGPLRVVASRSRAPAVVGDIAEALGAEVIFMGSAGAKAMAVVRGEADLYIHAGGQYEWDSAAPVAVAQRAGLHCSRIDGTELVYNSPESYLPDLLICRPELGASALAALRPMLADAPSGNEGR